MDNEFDLTGMTVGDLRDLLNKFPGYYKIGFKNDNPTLKVYPATEFNPGMVTFELGRKEK